MIYLEHYVGAKLVQAGRHRRHTRSELATYATKVDRFAVLPDTVAAAAAVAAAEERRYAHYEKDDNGEERDGTADDDRGGIPFRPAPQQAVERAFGPG